MSADIMMTDATLKMMSVTPKTLSRLEEAVGRVADSLGVDDRDIAKALNKASSTSGKDNPVGLGAKPIEAERAVMAKVTEATPEIDTSKSRFQDRVRASAKSESRGR